MKGIKREPVETGLEIAVIGMVGRFPGAKNIHEFWNNLKDGIESISFFSHEELKEAGISDELLNNPNFVKAYGNIEDKEYFDSAFFGYTPMEAEVMNPQVRLFHECAWEALEDAGYDPISSKAVIGVYAGANNSLNWQVLSTISKNAQSLGGFTTHLLSNKDLMSTRISHKLNLRGPSFTLFTACSTSLVAIHLACRALLTGECSMALAGGASITSKHKNGYLYQEGMIFSSDGHCRAFDAQADGTLFGEGIGIVVLKRAKEAIADGDNIYAIVKGTAINNDGMHKVDYAAPSVKGQVEVIRTVLKLARVDPESIGCIETHGTGTRLGDPLEISALSKAFNTNTRGYCAIGSVKPNIGHLNAAAGVTGFIKAVLSIKNKMIPAAINFEIPNKEIDWINSPFYLNSKLTQWENSRYPLRAGVNAFGFGGTNAHVILEEAPPGEDSPGNREWQLILLSAKTGSALERAAKNLAHYFQTRPDVNLANAAYTLQVGRHPFTYKRMVVCSRVDEAIEALLSPHAHNLQTSILKSGNPSVIFIFPGEESHEINMGSELYQSEQVFRTEVDHCVDIITPMMDVPVRDILYPGDKLETGRLTTWDRDLKPAASFIFQYALTRLVMNWGIKPQAVLGCGSGQFAAAWAAGVFSLEDAAALAVLRCKFMRQMPPSPMLITEFEEKVKEIKLNKPGINYLSNVTGKCLTGDEVTSPDYWTKHLGKTVSFTGEVKELLKQNNYIHMEIGSGKVLNSFEKPHTDKQSEEIVSHREYLAGKLGLLWLYGKVPDWEGYHRGEKRYRISLPTYPFDRRYYWLNENRFKMAIEKLSQETGFVKNNDIADWFYIPQWHRSTLPLDPISSHKQTNWMVFIDESLLGAQLVRQLESDNHIVITVRIGAAFKCLNPHEYIINPQKGNDYDRLFSELVKSKTIPGNIVHLWGLSVDDRGQLKPGEFEQTQDLGLYSLIYSARAIGNHCASNPIRWGVITNNMQNVTGEEEICPEKSTILGPVKIIPREYANITCCGIDIVHPGTDKRKVEVAVKNLISEFSADFSGDPVAAYRGDYRWTQTFDPIRINKKPQTQRLKPNGVYLVTGGLGGMGFRIAAHLAQTINARLILMDIADFPLRKEWKRWLAHNDKQGDVSQKISKILELEALGAAFDIQKVDVSNHQQMKKAISKAEKQWGKIDGVIHTAGMMDYSEVIQKRTREMIREVMAAKVTGTLILDDIFKTREPHFFVLFSSIGKILYKTKFGQVASNTANEFLDAFAFKKQKQGVFTLTINWNDWRNVGMAARPDVNPAIPGPGKFNDKDMFSISPSEGLEVFSRIIESNLPCAAVSPYDLNGLVNYVDHLNQQLAKSSGISNNQEDSRNFYDRPELSTQYIAPRNETEKTLSRIWQDFFGIKPAGVHDNFFELGGDSLKAISLATIIQRTFDVMVPIAEIFHKPVIEGLAEFIADAKKNTDQKMEEVVI